MKISIHTPCNIGEMRTGNARFHAPIQFDVHSFDQHILIFENSLF